MSAGKKRPSPSGESPNMVDAGSATRGAQKFLFAAYARIILSRVKSEMARRSRAFSALSSFIRFT